MKGFLRVLVLLFFPVLMHGQTYFNLTHSSGTQVVGSIPVTVTNLGGTINGLVCGAGPYEIGSNQTINNGFRFDFTYPVTALRFRFSNMGQYDTAAVFINNTFYPLDNTNISQSQSQTFCTGFTDVCTTHNGFLVAVGTGNNKAHIDVNPGVGINSISVMFGSTYTSGGLNFSVWYATDPHVYVKEPFLDTLFCGGDSVNIPYIVSDTFNNILNTFSVQLSDKNGDFTNGTILGSKNDFQSGNIRCGVPVNTPDGTGYRFRVISTLPADTSVMNVKPIKIAKYPALTASSNSPVCVGETIRLSAATDHGNAYLNWVGPGAFVSTLPDPSQVAEPKHTGEYKLTANNEGCITSASTFVTVKPIPSVVSIKNNSPMCENETLQLTAKASDTLASYAWTGPGGFVSEKASPVVSDVRHTANGVYSVKVTLDGCTSPADTTSVTIYPRPAKPVITVNTPIKPGDSLVFHIEGSPDATYQWSGPAGFTSTEQNPVKRLVDLDDEGEYTVVATIGSCTSSNKANVDVLQASLFYTLTPNPGIGEITIKGNYSADKTIPLEILNSAGQVVYSAEINNGQKFLDIKLDLKGKFGNGVYMMRIKLKNEILTTRFVLAQ